MAADTENQDLLAEQWANETSGNAQSVADDIFGGLGKDGGSARVLNQDEIDSLLGFDDGGAGMSDGSGLPRLSIRHWYLTNGCRCSRWSSTDWCG